MRGKGRIDGEADVDYFRALMRAQRFDHLTLNPSPSGEGLCSIPVGMVALFEVESKLNARVAVDFLCRNYHDSGLYFHLTLNYSAKELLKKRDSLLAVSLFNLGSYYFISLNLVLAFVPPCL